MKQVIKVATIKYGYCDCNMPYIVYTNYSDNPITYHFIICSEHKIVHANYRLGA